MKYRTAGMISIGFALLAIAIALAASIARGEL